MSNYNDPRKEWRALAALTDNKYGGYLTQLQNELFTQERVRVFDALQQAYLEYGQVSRDSVEKILGEFPTQLDVPTQVDLPPIIESLSTLAYRRSLRKCADDLIVLSENPQPTEDQAESIVNRLPSKAIVELDSSKAADRALQTILQKMNGTYRFIPTGFPQLDMSLEGEWPRNSVTLLGGLPGTGKSILAANCMLRGARDHGVNSRIIAYEMSAEAHWKRLWALVTGIDKSNIDSGNLTEEEFSKIHQASEYLKTLPVGVVHANKASIQGLINIMRRLRVEEGVEVFYIDHLQLIPNPPDMNRNDGLGVITKALDEFAKEHFCVVVLLTQLTKKDGGVTVRDSGNVTSVVETSMYLTTDSTDDIRQVTVRFEKNREGKLVPVPLLFDSPRMRFVDVSEKEKIAKIQGLKYGQS